MKTKIPYNAGDIVSMPGYKQNFMIAGHVWWPVERRNAYHCVRLDEDGTPTDKAEYIWDHDENWSLVA